MSDRYTSRNKRDAITSRLRLRSHDYREPGPYFVTICLEHRQCLFGSVRDSAMMYSAAGEMADTVWARIPERFPSVEQTCHVIMPNHMHCILTLTPDENGNIRENAPTLSDVVHWFKRQTIREYANGVATLGWQRYDARLWQGGFMEHVIRNNREMEHLEQYIEKNVAMWEDDTFHPSRR